MSAVCDIEVSDSNSYVFSSVRQGDLVIRLSSNEAGLHAGYTSPSSNALLSITKDVFRLGGNNSNVSVSNNILQASNINFTGSLTQNGVPFVSGGGSVAGISNLLYETSNLMTFHVGSNTSNDGFRWLTGSGSNEVMSLTGDGKLFAGSILPSTTLTYDLGSSNNRWRDLYLSGNTINMGGVQLTADSNNNFMIMDSNNNLKTIMTGEVQIGQSTGIMSEHAGQIMFKSMGSNVMTLCNTMISLNTNFQVAAPLNLQGLQINRRGGNALNVSLQPQFISNGCNIYINSGSNFGIGTSLPTQALDVNGNIMVGTQSAPGYISAGNLGMFRNRVINGDMRIAQRATSSNFVNNYGYCIDRFMSGLLGGNGTISTSQVTLTSTEAPYLQGFRHSMRCTASGVTSYPDSPMFAQYIENLNLTDLNWGTTNGVPVTLSFWFKATVSGSYSVAIRNACAGSQWYAYANLFSYTTGGQWQFITMTIPAPPSSYTWTMNTSTESAIGIQLFIGANSSAYTSTAGQWVNSPSEMAAGATIWITTNNNYIEMTGLQLEKGTIATPFEFRPFTVELQLCQRYFYVTPYITLIKHSNAVSYGGVQPVTITFPTIIRTIPSNSSLTMKNITGVGLSDLTSANLGLAPSLFGILVWNGGAAGAVGDYKQFTLDVNAEL